MVRQKNQNIKEKQYCNIFNKELIFLSKYLKKKTEEITADSQKIAKTCRESATYSSPNFPQYGCILHNSSTQSRLGNKQCYNICVQFYAILSHVHICVANITTKVQNSPITTELPTLPFQRQIYLSASPTPADPPSLETINLFLISKMWSFQKCFIGSSLMLQCGLPMQGAQVPSPVRALDSPCCN